MKKLLSFLGVISIGAVPVMTVIACGTDNKNEEKEDNYQVINGDNIKLDSDKILDIILQDGDEDILTNGEAGKTLQKFLNVFSFALVSKIADHSEKNQTTRDAIVKALKDANSSYVNDEFLESVDKEYQNFLNRVIEPDWKAKTERAEEEAKSEGRNFEEYFKEQLEKEYNKKRATSAEYKADFIFERATSGANNNPSSILTNEIITNFARGTGFLSTATGGNSIINQISQNVFTPSIQLTDNHTLNFNAQNNRVMVKTADNQPGSKTRQDSWYGQFDNWINGLAALSTATDEVQKRIYDDYSSYLINLINATGGLSLEDFLEQKPTETAYLISDVKWATPENIKTDVFPEVTKWSNNLLKRVDQNFEQHFGDNVTTGNQIPLGIQNLNASHEIPGLQKKYSELFSEILDLTTNKLDENSTGINGLFSNSQRYFTNLYYTQKKPLAITEFVVKPWETGNGIFELKDEIDTKPFMSSTNTKYIGLFNFIKLFVNSAIDPNNNSNSNLTDYTKTMFTDESNFSWDILLENNGNLRNISHGTDNIAGSWVPENQLWNDFESSLEVVQHNDLLTVDSSDGYNDILKYSVYDFLENGKAEYSTWNEDPRAKYNGDFDYSTLSEAFQNYARPIAGLIHNLDRSGTVNADTKTEANVYQVLNAEQGILAYVADDGIHFVRIEGYPLIQSLQLKEQKRLTTTTNESTNNYASVYQYGLNIAGVNDNANTKAVNTAASNTITTDFENKNKNAQELSKIKYADLNSMFGNNYLEFLANASIPKISTAGAGTGKYNFNLKNEVESWLSTSATSNDKYWIAIWDYIKEIFGYKNEANLSSDEKLFNEFFDTDLQSLDGDNERIKNLFQSYKKIILTTLRSTRNQIQVDSTLKLSEQWIAYENKHENEIVDKDRLVSYRPWNYISSGTKTSGVSDLKKVDDLDSVNLWKYDNTTATMQYSFANLNFNNYLVDDKHLKFKTNEGRR